MSTGRVVVLRGASVAAADDGAEVLTFEEVRGRIVGGGAGSLLFRWRDATLRTRRIDQLSKPLNTALILRAMSRGACRLEDEGGRVLRLGGRALAGLLRGALRDLVGKGHLLRTVSAEVAALEFPTAAHGCGAPADGSGFPLYLRTDLIFGLRSGGSVGHIAGVLNNLDRFTGKPVFLTTDPIPTVREDLETHVLLPAGRYRDFNELPAVAFNLGFTEAVAPHLGGRRPAFVYQRYSTYNYSGAKLARAYGVPFVLEYNGSEIWISRNWGRPLKYEALAQRVEALNLSAAAVVVVVSRPMRDELAGRGVDPGKILVNPNGVDPERYSPAVDGSAIRATHQFEGRTVVGFIGTFGRWHGAEVLVEAFGLLLARRPDLRDRVRLLMIGDGNTMPQVRAGIERLGLRDVSVLTGTVAQQEGPAHLAACDILAAPHVPNPDGTPFFGSPTKLFEYMAMGRGIVASGLDQIGEVLRHDKTAWLVRPGDVAALAEGLLTLIGDTALRERLGRAAREEAVSRHTWAEHTRRIVEKLKERCAATG